MQNYIRKRAVRIAHHILQTSNTVRQTAEVFGISKSTVHKDVSERLPRINRDLAEQVRGILDKNKAERHIRGGEATRQKYACME
ncbi:MAG: sporulation transcriptional regulator SpoIIID [Syntrophomonas sp.]|uniref:sporulation transcriptional regulator SpoIIID n=1 Tax=Syntrophomonas sp. TaxID=2053627 RepID=UPI00260A9598|nr:sporulation transcriptional regulator SpoIIID [Syntrophomonas sp.]MDD2509549.1 sporulation transcriptional regulator SpoIIID [Syntrophomonas sp.]MDD3878420.1 sporulation transcriptional regulator SpoIIID [Syntrophomonas sp.]MDD4625481.1 sporulation transcriptional regulator SpoIIID [Syntrophomonas sp.]